MILEQKLPRDTRGFFSTETKLHARHCRGARSVVLDDPGSVATPNPKAFSLALSHL
jgi:hypothetical protein